MTRRYFYEEKTGKLSIADGEEITAEEFYRRGSAQVVGLTLEEYESELSAQADEALS